MLQYSPPFQLRSPGKLVAKYVHSANYKIQPTSLDKTTGIFTCAGGLLANVGAASSVVMVTPVVGSYVNGIIPRELKSLDSHKLHVIDDTTFYIQNSSNSYADTTSYPDVNNTGVDPTKFYFETIGAGAITVDLSSFNITELMVRFTGMRGRAGWPYMYLLGTYTGGTYNANLGTGGVDGRDFMAYFQETYWRYDSSSKLLLGQIVRSASKTWNETNGGWTITGTSEVNNRDFMRYDNFKITGVNTSIPMANGSVLEVFDLKGA